MPWLLLPCLASAGERLLERGDLVLERAALSVEIARIVLPEPVSDPLDDAADRTCRATASYDPELGRVVFAPLGCHPAVSASVAAAIGGWSMQLRPPPTSQQDILVAWFLFPDQPGKPVELALSLVPGTEVLALPEGVALAAMGRPTRREPVLGAPVTLETCSAIVKLDEEGSPYNFEIDGCSTEAQGAVRNGLLDWKFSPSTVGTRPVRVRVPLTVRFAGDGTAGIRVLPAADDEMRFLASDPDRARAVAEELLPPVAPLPEGPPLFVVHHSFYAPVEVYGLGLPPPADGPARCTVALQVRSDRRSYAWTEEPCDAAVRDGALAAAQTWLLKPSEERAPGEVFARFRADLWWKAAGSEPMIVIDEREIVGEGPLPSSILPYVGPEPIRQVSPKGAEGKKGTCVLAVEIDGAGRPTEITPETCPEDLLSPARTAVGKWRWSPARMGGARVASHTRVSVRFR